MMSQEEAGVFASEWLPAWTGNDPERLASYYSDDCLYIDQSIPNGAKGKEDLLRHFRKLLGKNPDWVWSQLEAIPMEGGFFWPQPAVRQELIESAEVDPMYGLLQPSCLGWKVDENQNGVHTCAIQQQLAST